MSITSVDIEFDVNENLPDNESYKIVDKGLRSTGRARPLGRGNVSIVFRAKYKETMDRAIKFLSPKADGDQQSEIALEELTRAFKNEIGLLSTITHTSISKIVDSGQIRIGDSDLLYYAMDIVEGDSFGVFCEEKATTVRDVLLVLDQILDALGHLHVRGYYHMDVKEENILVHTPPGSRPRAVLLDLGGAKQVVAPSSLGLRENTIYVSTEKATRSERLLQLGKAVPRSKLATWGVDLDFYAFGMMIDRALKGKTLPVKIEKELTTSGLAALKWIVSHLTEGLADRPATERHYQNASQIRADLERLLPQYTWPLGLPELSFVGSPTSIQLPSERVGLTPSLLRIINHPIFQRLRNIPQLEYVHFTYPGARQSRFEHSISTFHLARLFLVRLLEYPDFRMVASPAHVQGTLLAALLHDIGHYSLSHMFEDFAANEEIGSEKMVPTDDSLFRSFVSPVSGDHFGAIIKRSLSQKYRNAPSFLSLIQDLYPQSYELMLKIKEPGRKSPDPITLLHSLIDSAIDVDKIAYIRDDSFATGVRFGQGLDISGLVQSLIPPRGEDRLRGAIAITENGLAAAEAVVLARFWMIDRVYWHRPNRAIMAMHKFVISDLIETKRLTFDKYFEQTLFSSQSDATEFLAQEFDRFHAASLAATGKATNPLEGILGAGRDIYKRILTISNGPSERDKALYRVILSRKAGDILTLAEEIRQQLTKICPDIHWQYGDVVVDIPHKRREDLGSNVLVYLDRDPNTARNLYGGENPVSPLLRGIPENFEYFFKKFRIFVHPNIMDHLAGRSDLERVQDKIREYLEDYFGIPTDLPS